MKMLNNSWNAQSDTEINLTNKIIIISNIVF